MYMYYVSSQTSSSNNLTTVTYDAIGPQPNRCNIQASTFVNYSYISESSQN